MNRSLKFVLAGAAAVLAVGIGIYAVAPPAGPTVGGVSPTASPTVSPSVPLSPSPTIAGPVEPTPLATETALPTADLSPFAPGTYIVDDPFPVRLAVTVGQGWRLWAPVGEDAAAIYKDSYDPPAGYGIVVAVIDNVYADACDRFKGQLEPPIGPTPNDLAEALAAQPQTVSSPITDTMIDGHAGKYLEYSVPTLVGSCNPDFSLHRWSGAAGSRQALQGESDMVWILDVDGVRVVIDAFSFPGATAADLAELRSIVESIQIGPAGAG